MRLKSLKVSGYKNFENINFDHFDTDKEDVTTVLIGRNGSGKSNLFEILVTIFRNYEYPSNKTDFTYTLEYIINDIPVKIEGGFVGEVYKHQAFIPSATFGGYVPFIKQAFIEAGFLPQNIIAYYSGSTSRLESLFAHHQRRYVAQLTKNTSPNFRRLFIAKEEHLPLVVLTQLVYPNKRNRAFNELNLKKAKEVKISLGKPSGFKPELLNEDDRYWGARGKLKDFLFYLETLDYKRDINSHSFPISSGVEDPELQEEFIFDFFDSISILGRDLEDLSGFVKSPNEFFRLMEEAYRLNLIRSIEIELVQGEEHEKTFLYDHLSEGEKQLLLVLGIIELTKNENSLILLDEPDTHLNPRWKYEYVELIKSVIGRSMFGKVQVLLATHEPLIISGLDKENVLHFKRNDNGSISMDHIDEDLKGKGIEAILTSKLFGLNTTLDKETLSKSINRRKLMLKQLEEELSIEESQLLQSLNEELFTIDFNQPFDDPLYRDYIKAIQNLDKYKVSFISEKQRTRRQNLANEIISKLMEE